MNIKLGTKGKILNEVVILQENQKLTDNNIKIYFENELKLKEEQKLVAGTLTVVDGKSVKHLIVVKIKDLKDIQDLLEDIVGTVGPIIKKLDKQFFLDLDNIKIKDDQKLLLAQLLVVNLYHFTKYQTKNNEFNYGLVVNSKSIDKKEFQNFIDSLKIVRDLVNEPSSFVTPEKFEETAVSLFKKNKSISLEIIKGKELKKLGLNGIYEVGKGSIHEPRLLVISYKGTPKNEFDFGLIGKGVCFDSGGYNLKPTGFIEDMSMDMAGAATVLGVLNYFVNNGFKKNIVLGIPLAENQVSGNAYKPGDIIKMYNGKTTEISNTDAEGRLLLADALAYVEKKFDPTYMFDIATLTGAQLVALGTKISAIIGNNSELNQKIQKISWDIKERVWELPNFGPYFKLHKSNLADMKNAATGRLNPGTILGGAFLSQFIKNKNWVHFDVAGPATTFGGSDDLWGNYASGFGFRLFVKLLEELK